MSEKTIDMNPNWAALKPPNAANDRAEVYEKVQSYARTYAEPGKAPGVGLGLAAEEIARAFFIHGSDAAAQLSALCEQHLVVPAVHAASTGEAGAEALLGLLAYQQTQIVSDPTRPDGATSDRLTTELGWLTALSQRAAELDRVAAQRALVIAVASRALDLIPRFVRLRNTATPLVERPDDPDGYLRLIATFPDIPLTWIELLYVARAYRQHVQGGGLRAVGSTVSWLQRAVLHRRWPDPDPPPPPPPPPLWTRPEVIRAMRLFTPPPSVPVSTSGWTSIECWGLHGLWGGSAIRIDCDGSVVAERGSRRPSRYQAVMSNAGLAELDWLLGDTDLAAIPDSTGSAVPDTIRFELAVDTPHGRTVVSRWAHDPHDAFDALREWLTLAAEAVIATHAPVGQSKQGDWMPPSRQARRSAPPRGPQIGGLTLGDVLPLAKWIDGSQTPSTTAIGLTGPQLRTFWHVVPAAQPLRCASLVTDGLRLFGRDEMILTVPESILTPGADHVPASLLKSIAASLENGPRLGPGAFVGAKPSNLPGWSRISGFALERAWPMDGVDLPAGCLSLHALIGTELGAADRFGTLRVLARVGRATQFFPTPSWSDPSRAQVATPEEPSILSRVTTLHFPGVTVTRERPWIVLRVARPTQPSLAAAMASIEPGTPLAFLASLHVGADACLVWRAGQVAAEANARPGAAGARLGGCFLLLPPQSPTDGGGILEDGFSMSLTAASAAGLHASLLAGTNLDLPPAQPSASGLRLEWTGELA